MGDDLLNFFGPVEDKMQGIIKVIGVGGGGCNAVKNMYDEGVQGVTFAVCNTDSQSLSRSPVPVKIMLGDSGLGAGANPELGRREAENNAEDIEKLLSDGTKMVFVTAGMGGGTGTGAAPVVAGIAKGMGLLAVGVVTIPFYFEKKRKIIKALKGVDEPAQERGRAADSEQRKAVRRVFGFGHIAEGCLPTGRQRADGCREGYCGADNDAERRRHQE